MTSDMPQHRELLRARFVKILSPAIDARAPYAKVMIDMLVTAALTAQQELLAAKVNEVDVLTINLQAVVKRSDKQSNQLAEAQSEIERLTKALEPFVEMAKRFDYEKNPDAIATCAWVYISDLRRAQAEGGSNERR